jgi:predicted Zn-dependent peptidase
MAGQIVPSTKSKDNCALDIVYEILSYLIFERLRDKEAISYDAGADYKNEEISGNVATYATCKKSDFKKAKKCIGEEFLRLSKGEIDDELIYYAIEGAKKKFILDQSATMDKANALMDFWMRGDIYRINSYIEDLEKITPNQVREVAKKYIMPDKLTWVALGNL